VARLGGDEFALLVEGLEQVDEAATVAERIAETLRAPVRLPSTEVFVSASMGIAFSGGAEASDVLLRNADTAMYHAKAAGKGCHAVFDQTMNDRVVEQHEVETGLRRAIANDEFEVYYQPLLDLELGVITGVEALIRWHHPVHGLIAPGKFITVAEETGLIVPIGKLVLEKACADAARWHRDPDAETKLVLNVNLSGKQLQRADIVDQVRDALDKTGFDPTYLKLEITESTLMSDVEQTTEKLHALRKLGIKIAIDDFGTGYSSMSTLNSLPVDTVKIDRSFIAPIVEHEEAAAIVSAIVMLSRSLSLDVTAEGIETPEQVSRLQGLGCNLGQGYLFAKPLPASELESRLKSGLDSFVGAAKPNPSELVEELLRELDSLDMDRAA
jgi:predicted signal transduction protein with EAL and GGDEF domain